MIPRIYELSNKRLLARWLGLSLDEIYFILGNLNNYYNVFVDNGREIQQPLGTLFEIHKKIKKLLDQIPLPDYVHFARKGRSYKTNALMHIGAKVFETMDIKSFYKSSQSEFVFRFFRYRCLIPADVAWPLTDLVTFRGYLPTGSPVSQLIAFWSHSNLFNAIDSLAQKREIKFTQLVDDMTFSSDRAFGGDPLGYSVNRILKKQGLKLKRSKHKKAFCSPIEITGAVLDSKGNVFAPSRLKKKLFENLKKFKKDPSAMDEKSLRSSIGLLRSIRQLNSSELPMLYHELRKCEKKWNEERRRVRLARQAGN